MFLWAETISEETFTLQVNEGEARDIVLYDAGYLGGYTTWDKAYPVRPVIVPVTLRQGENAIVLTAGENYTFWIHSFAISPTDARVYASATNLEARNYPISSWSAIGGDVSKDTDSVGLNAFDEAVNYGKTGYAEYEIYAEEAGVYTVGIYAMAGNDLAGRAKLTLNGRVLQFDGKEYYTFNTSAGWGGDSWNYIDMTLNAGVNTLRIENSLARVNADKTAEVETGGVLVSNWWLHELSVVKKASVALVLDTSAVQTQYNPGWEPSTDGLVVWLSIDGERQEQPLSADEYSISVGANAVTVTYTGSDYTGVQSATYGVSRVNEGVPHEGRTIGFDGTQSTGELPWYSYAAIVGEGMGVCEGRLFWIMEAQTVEGGGYIFGSGGSGSSENRQMTLTLNVNNTGAAGTYLLRLYVNANNYELNAGQIKVNDGEYVGVNINGPATDGETKFWPFVYEVELKGGMNTITLRMCDQYSAWFRSFEISPIAYEDKASYAVEEAARSGDTRFDTNAGNFMATSGDRTLVYYARTAEAGRYEFAFRVGSAVGKVISVSLNGGEQTTLTTTGAQTVSLIADLEANTNCRIELLFDGTTGNVDFYGMTKAFCRPVDSIRLDTSGVDLTIDKGANLNLAQLGVYVVYTGEDEETKITSGYTVDTSGFNADTAGTYTVKVYITAYPDISATFDVTVEAERTVTGIEVDASAASALENGAAFDQSKLTVTLVYSDGTRLRAMSNQFVVTPPEGFDSKAAGEYTFTVSYAQDCSISTTFTVTVAEAQTGSDGGTETGCGSVMGTGAALLGIAAVAGTVLLKRRKF